MASRLSFVVPVHEAPLRLLRRPVLHHGAQDPVLVVQKRPAVPFLTNLVPIPPLIPGIEAGGEGHVQLEQGGFRRVDGEDVLPKGQDALHLHRSAGHGTGPRHQCDPVFRPPPACSWDHPAPTSGSGCPRGTDSAGTPATPRMVCSCLILPSAPCRGTALFQLRTAKGPSPYGNGPTVRLTVWCSASSLCHGSFPLWQAHNIPQCARNIQQFFHICYMGA